MFSKRNVALLFLGLCALTALRPEGDFLKRLSARHVKDTVFVSAGSRRLAGFFDGLTPDPHWNAVKARQPAVPQCLANRGGGMFARWVALLEGTAYAQVNCNYSICDGNWQKAISQSCGTECSEFDNVTFSPNFCDATYIDGSHGCSGSGPCSNGCNNSSCSNVDCGGGGGCIENGGSCDWDHDCCSLNCDSGTCRNLS